jgi:hypothetical protein
MLEEKEERRERGRGRREMHYKKLGLILEFNLDSWVFQSDSVELIFWIMWVLFYFKRVCHIC